MERKENRADPAAVSEHAKDPFSGQTKPPYRVGVGVTIGALLWIVPYLGINALLLPAKVVEIAPDQKEVVVATLATFAMVTATLANIIIGAFSDLTRSRFGKRTPWLWVGSVGTAAATMLVYYSPSVPLLILNWCVYQVFLNSLVAPLLATIADRVAPKFRGTISAMYAIGFTVGMASGQLIGAQFLKDLRMGYIVMAVLVFCAAPISATIIREPSSASMPKKNFNKETFLTNFMFPTKHCRDFYLALFGRLFILAAGFAITGYQLYIFTDYIGADDSTTQSTITIMSLCLMVVGVIVAAIIGPLSDKLAVRKMPVIVSAFLIAIGLVFPWIFPYPWAMIAYAIVGAGIGNGAFNAVDQALNLEVLPNPETAAKDLGILNLAQSGSQIIGPLIASAVIGIAGYHAIFPASIVLAMVGCVAIAMIKSTK
ncbi:MULTISPECIES: MFS transporter [Actinotignum]|uniref:MFS transporter n=1 Tax=Actinotignum timonense TaxID=1870995 RepID=A0ABU5GBP9_9ACTO|nr:MULTISPECIES: MFS transporter [Actinotignum]MDE1558149.1 MFS transporter [Actinotignum schaalii]MDE1662817.1 MFS transporter [Actinotignum schaalii]MDK6372985.1 MFS transporter [Actinotignum timonense]MDK6589896.1 MFS transporter [Actinotignum timonense]MDK6629967.1 MFS transporter [Actinotignum timonense]